MKNPIKFNFVLPQAHLDLEGNGQCVTSAKTKYFDQDETYEQMLASVTQSYWNQYKKFMMERGLHCGI